MNREIDLTKTEKHAGRPFKAPLLTTEIIKDEVMIDKINQFSEEKYDQISSTLRINPFLPDATSSQFQVNTLDEYYFTYKGENINLGLVIKNKNYTHRQKRKIIKYAFSNWIKDYQKLERDTTKGIREQVSLMDDIKYSRFPILFILVFSLLMFINIMLFFSYNSVFQIGFLAKWSSKINGRMLTNLTLDKVTAIAVSLNFLTLFFGFFHNKVLRQSRRQYMLTKNNVTFLYEQMKHEFMSRAKAAKKYFLRSCRKRKYKPYPVTKIDMAEYSIENVKKYAENATMYTASFKKLSKKMRFFKVILIYGTSGSLLAYYLFLTVAMLVR